MKLTLLALLPLFALPCAPAQEAKPAPAPQVQVYDEKADAKADVDAALARAKRENKRVLIQWGANWCVWCRALHEIAGKDAGLRKKLLYEYEVVRVDVGRFDKHMELARSLGADFKSIPYLTVLAADGQPLAQSNTEPFEIAGTSGHDAKKLVEFLTQHEAKPLEAAKVRATALARANAEGKRVFLHFGAPWCGWCHRLENWMAKPNVAAVLGKEFVDLKIDEDRMTGGKDMIAAERKLAGVEGGGIPWFVLLDSEGKQLANSNAHSGNIGFPVKDEEVAHFIAMLEKACKTLTPSDIAALRADLVAEREADERKRAAR